MKVIWNISLLLYMKKQWYVFSENIEVTGGWIQLVFFYTIGHPGSIHWPEAASHMQSWNWTLLRMFMNQLFSGSILIPSFGDKSLICFPVRTVNLFPWDKSRQNCRIHLPRTSIRKPLQMSRENFQFQFNFNS